MYYTKTFLCGLTSQKGRTIIDTSLKITQFIYLMMEKSKSAGGIEKRRSVQAVTSEN